GQTLTLLCSVSERAPAGAVKWLKAAGGRNRTVYDQRRPRPRVARAVGGSNTDFTILIRDARPDDAGTYYCVKERAGTENQVACSGGGTTVSVYERSPFPSVAVAAATLSLLLLLFLVALCVYRRHRAGERRRARGGCRGGHPCFPRPRGLVPIPAPQSGSQWHIPHPMSYMRLPPLQGCAAVDAELHYADLQPLPAAPRRAPACAAASEYASVQRAAP
ncbi:SIRBL protein, partial [Crypturellus soui]|nr:SIRBL protein [Crypturellus soui]